MKLCALCDGFGYVFEDTPRGLIDKTCEMCNGKGYVNLSRALVRSAHHLSQASGLKEKRDKGCVLFG